MTVPARASRSTPTPMPPRAMRTSWRRAPSPGAPIRAMPIETELGTRYTVDTLAALGRRYPQHRFLWIMGADNLLHFHRWKRWRDIARQVPIVVAARPQYIKGARLAPAMAWLRRFHRREANAKHWARWELPALVIIKIPLDATSATAIRARDPDWAASVMLSHIHAARGALHR